MDILHLIYSTIFSNTIIEKVNI